MNGSEESLGSTGSNGTTSSGGSSYLHRGSTPAAYTSSSPRLRRLEDMKKSLMGSSSGPTSSYTSSFGSKFGSGGVGERGGYRLASLDRLAQRQKLYEANGSVLDSGPQSLGSLGGPTSPVGVNSGPASLGAPASLGSPPSTNGSAKEGSPPAAAAATAAAAAESATVSDGSTSSGGGEEGEGKD